ncbi:MAG TPA: pitrilysin family protein, partial [Dehalococcoidia bacterium]|nr:pitrilysin family protein [Dehalococcoidia bacterium]
DRLELAVDVLADMIAHATLSEEEIERERTVVQAEIQRAHDQPAAWASELLAKACFGDQPIGWPIAGSLETVGSLTRRDMVDHVRAWYTPPNMVVSVAGAAAHDEVVRLAERLFGDLPARPAPPVPPASAELPRERVIVETRDVAQANLGIAVRALARQDPDRYALMIMNTVLGRGMSSRLFKEVREKRGLAYSVGSGVARYVDTGVLSISAGVSPDKLEEATTVILQELARLADEPVGEAELQKAKDYTIGSFRLGLETTMALAQRAGEALLMTGEIEPVDEVVERLREVTPDDVRRVAGRIVRQEALSMAVVGPPGADPERLETLLASAA